SVSQIDTTNQTDSVIYQTDEIIVTGTRTYKKIIDIPYSVQRINQSQFKLDRRVGINDILGTIPGLFLQSRYGNHDVRISIRGFGSRSNTGIRGVRILLDGIPESEPDGQTRIEAIDFNSIGQIEVVKGNSSSLYTNAPGGVINFINDIQFDRSFAINFNDFGSFGLRRNGLKAGVRTDDYGFLMTYTYHNFNGYREHSEDYWHILNTVLESTPGDNSRLQLYGYFVLGLIRLPGSLTKEEFEQDPWQADSVQVSRDKRRVSNKGRFGVRFNTYFGKKNNNEFEITGYGTIKYFERTSKEYRIINRYGVGSSFRVVNHSKIFGRENEFSVGGDLLYQAGPIEYYNNINGKKGDILSKSIEGTIANTGFYFQNSFNIIKGKFDLLVTGRYDKVIFDERNLTFEVQNSVRRFEAFTPKAALNYKFTPSVAAYTSYGLSFDSPAGNELDNPPTSTDPNVLLNPDLEPQKSKNFELGIKGNLIYRGTKFFNNIYFEGTFFNSIIDDEIVPFEVFSDVFFRNSAKTNRTGLEIGGNVEIVKGLKFKAAYTFSHFKYDEYIARTIEFDTSSSIVIEDKDFSGNIVPSVPKHNLVLDLSYQYQFNDIVTAFTKGHYWYVSDMFVNDGNTEETSSYNIFNSALGLDLKFNKFNILLSGGVNNIFDKVFSAFININSAKKQYYEAGEPRSYYASLRLGYTF
ncbi:MAG: TonB-dependent receptor, partial [Ignavibacteria bacterium]|nr:TonB-dependent receptor [Ignavibacteria bacterium]